MKTLGRIIGIIFFLALIPLFVTKVESPLIEYKQSAYFLEEIATDKMQDLLETNYWSHTNSNGCDFECRTKPYENRYKWIGENLYKGPCNQTTAFNMWEESPAHNDVLKHPYSHEILLEEEYKNGYCYIILIRAEL
jgi:hypothetical protein